MKPLLLPILMMFILMSPASATPISDEKITNPYAAFEDYFVPPDSDYRIITDNDLKRVAVEYGVIPENPTEEYTQEQIKEENSVIIWILMTEEKKIPLIDALKEKFKADGIAIRNPSLYYAHEINGVIWNSIQGDKFFSARKKGAGLIFRTIAIMEGDFDDGSGRTAMELFKDWFGEEEVEWFKQTYPEKYQYLIELDRGDNDE